MIKSLSITTRILSTLTALVMMLMFVGGFAIWQMSESQKRFEYVQTRTLPGINRLDDARTVLVTGNISVYRHLLVQNDQQKVQLERLIATTDRQFDQFIHDQQKSNPGDTNESRRLQAITDNMAQYRQERALLLQSSRASNPADVAALVATSRAPTTARAVNQALDEEIRYNRELAGRLRDANTASYRHALILFGAMLFGSIGLAVAVGIGLYRTIRRGVAGLRTTLNQVKESHDLTLRVPVLRADELGVTAAAFNALADELAEVIATVHASVGSVTTASRQIAAGNLDLSQRTEEQAASLERTSASIDTLAETVRLNADGAQEADALARAAAATAREGLDSIQRMVQIMETIRTRSTSIAEITALIDSVAFQTNILALNAAVEAARAGENGRGFSVVASEVRTLATRAGSAAKEIRALINASVDAVRSGSGQIAQTGRTIETLQQAVERVTVVVGDIARASAEQRIDIEHVNTAINQIGQTTQQNAALVEEASAAAQALDNQAERLANAVSVFQFARPHTA